MKDYTYCVYVITPKGRDAVLLDCKKIWRARRVALSIKVKPGRRSVEITRDNRVLPGGQNALDGMCLQLWLEAAADPTNTSKNKKV